MKKLFLLSTIIASTSVMSSDIAEKDIIDAIRKDAHSKISPLEKSLTKDLVIKVSKMGRNSLRDIKKGVEVKVSRAKQKGTFVFHAPVGFDPKKLRSLMPQDGAIITNSTEKLAIHDFSHIKFDHLGESIHASLTYKPSFLVAQKTCMFPVKVTMEDDYRLTKLKKLERLLIAIEKKPNLNITPMNPDDFVFPVVGEKYRALQSNLYGIFSSGIDKLHNLFKLANKEDKKPASDSEDPSSELLGSWVIVKKPYTSRQAAITLAANFHEFTRMCEDKMSKLKKINEAAKKAVTEDDTKKYIRRLKEAMDEFTNNVRCSVTNNIDGFYEYVTTGKVAKDKAAFYLKQIDS